MNTEEKISVALSPDEIRYIIRCGGALIVNVADNALPTYCGLTADEIYDFSGKMRRVLEDAGLDL